MPAIPSAFGITETGGPGAASGLARPPALAGPRPQMFSGAVGFSCSVVRERWLNRQGFRRCPPGSCLRSGCGRRGLGQPETRFLHVKAKSCFKFLATRPNIKWCRREVTKPHPSRRGGSGAGGGGAGSRPSPFPGVAGGCPPGGPGHGCRSCPTARCRGLSAPVSLGFVPSPCSRGPVPVFSDVPIPSLGPLPRCCPAWDLSPAPLTPPPPPQPSRCYVRVPGLALCSASRNRCLCCRAARRPSRAPCHARAAEPRVPGERFRSPLNLLDNKGSDHLCKANASLHIPLRGRPLVQQSIAFSQRHPVPSC